MVRKSKGPKTEMELGESRGRLCVPENLRLFCFDQASRRKKALGKQSELHLRPTRLLRTIKSSIVFFFRNTGRISRQ